MKARAHLPAFLLLSLTAAACSQPASGAEAHPVPVKVRTVSSDRGGGPIRYSGSLEPASRVDMAFRVGGYVEALGEIQTETGERPLDKGDFVTKGTVLARLRVTDYAQKVRLARAQLGEARAAERLTREEVARAHRLFDGDAITRAELDKAIAQADSAAAQVQGAMAQLDEAALAMSDTVLRAPMDGVILARNVEVGKLVAPGEPAIALADIRTVKAVFGAPQLQVEQLRVGSPLSIYVGAESESRAPEKLLAARVTRIAPAADTNGRVFSIEATLPNDDGALRPGTVVSFRVPDAARARPALVVPLRAVLRSPRTPHGFAVFVLDGDGDRAIARLREVKLGEVIGNDVTVTDGLAAEQRVVTVGSTLLRDGTEAVVIR